MLKVYRPGGVMVDPGFVSASPSITGVRNYTSKGSVYIMIHCKTPSNMVGYSIKAHEGEVLFRPGTRFQIDAVWENVNGLIPASAPAEAKAILIEEGGGGGTKLRLDDKGQPLPGAGGKLQFEKVRVIEVTEM
jgi:hypothetical protein